MFRCEVSSINYSLSKKVKRNIFFNLGSLRVFKLPSGIKPRLNNHGTSHTQILNHLGQINSSIRLQKVTVFLWTFLCPSIILAEPTASKEDERILILECNIIAFHSNTLFSADLTVMRNLTVNNTWENRQYICLYCKERSLKKN